MNDQRILKKKKYLGFHKILAAKLFSTLIIGSCDSKTGEKFSFAIIEINDILKYIKVQNLL